VEEIVAFSALPSVVKEQIENSAGGGIIQSVEAINKPGQPVVYEALVKTGDARSEITVAADGKLLSVERTKAAPAKKIKTVKNAGK
jgi:hypothetical protein